MQPRTDREPKKGCDHFDWYDPQMSERAKELINQLRMEKKEVAKRLPENSSPQTLLIEIQMLKEEFRQLRRSCVCLIVSLVVIALLLLTKSN